MGVVRLAHDPALDRRVAIKTLPPALAADPERVARLRREARSLAQLNHPNIAQIHQLLDHDGELCLVLEYVEGRTLADLLAERGPLPPDEAWHLA